MSLKDKLSDVSDHFKKKELKISGNMKLKTLRKQFKEAFGCTLRIYNGKRFANVEYTLAKIRKGGTDQKFTLKANWKVIDVEDKFKEVFGITVQIALPDDSELADNNLTIGQVARKTQ